MKRLFCAALLAGTAFASAPADAAGVPGPYVTVTRDGSTVRVGSGIPGQPLFGASVDTATGRVCFGFSLQRPLCVPFED